MKKTVYFAAALAAILCLGVSASAEGVIVTPRAADPIPAPAAAEVEEAEEEVKEDISFTIPDGMKILRVTSSLTYTENAAGPGAAPLYDGDLETTIKLDFEPTEPHWLSVRMAVGVRQTLTGFAYIMEGEPGTVVTIRMYGTNDSTQSSWTTLGLNQEAIDENGWKILTIDWEGETEKYSFYRLDITIDKGDTLTLSELRLLKPADEPEYAFEHLESVEPGELPPVVEIVEEEPAEETSSFLYRGILPFLWH